MDSPIHSASDKCGYRNIKLSNGLRALLIAKPLTDNQDNSRKKPPAAVSLCVAAGSFMDPERVPGLAHFLEHMVFQGTSKYPADSGMDHFLAKYGGSCDAVTDCETTMFYFVVENAQLEGALDRFSGFFVEPLLKEDAVDQEVKVVDSEFRINVPIDRHRIEQMFSNIAKKTHPASNFMWGSADTLRPKSQDNATDIYSELRSFHKRYYVASNMALVVSAYETLDQLEKSIRKHLLKVPPFSEPKPDFSPLNPPFENTTFNKIIKVVPVKNTNQLIMSWCMESQQSNYRCKPLGYIGWLLGHQGKGSVSAFLRKKQWKKNLVAGAGESDLMENSLYSIFQISITLTESGLDHISEVVTTIFQYLSLLRSHGPSQKIFEELKLLKDIHFRWAEKPADLKYVQELSVAMHQYEPKHYIMGENLLISYDEKIIRQCMDWLSPDRVNLMVLSAKYEKICDQECKWFKTRFTSEKIPDNWLKTWAAPEVNTNLHLPLTNDFVVTDFTLIVADAQQSEYPVMLSETSCSKLWYKKDDKFKVPHTYIFLNLTSTCFSQTVESVCLTDLYINIVEENLAEETYNAEEADLSYEIKEQSNGIVLKFSGYSNKIMDLVTLVMRRMFNFQCSDEEFQSAVSELSDFYNNDPLTASKFNRDLEKSILFRQYWTLRDRLNILPTMFKKNLDEFVKNFLSTTNLEVLVQGNCSSKEASALEHWLLLQLKVTSRPPTDSRSSSSANKDTRVNCSVIQLPDYPSIHRRWNLNEHDRNCVITNFYQHGLATIREQVMLELLLEHMYTPLYDNLRQDNHYGYDVTCSARSLWGIIGYSITIGSQSNKFSMRQLDMGIEDFLNDFHETLGQWCTASFFQGLIRSKIDQLQQRDASLSEEVTKNWSEVLEGSYLFNRSQLEIAELGQLTLDEFTKFCKLHLPQTTKSRKLSIQVVGGILKRKSKKSTKNQKTPQESGKDAIPTTLKDRRGNTFFKDVANFKAACKTYPASHIV